MSRSVYMVSILTFAFFLHLLTTCVAESSYDCSLRWWKSEIQTERFDSEPDKTSIVDYIEVFWERNPDKKKSSAESTPRTGNVTNTVNRIGAVEVEVAENGYTFLSTLSSSTVLKNPKGNGSTSTRYRVAISRGPRPAGVEFGIAENLHHILSRTKEHFSTIDPEFKKVASEYRIRLMGGFRYADAQRLLNTFDRAEEKKKHKVVLFTHSYTHSYTQLCYSHIFKTTP
eukprot:GHVS01053862.1.p1 GENE.GHVS01053862.1~~GHVS01053862.1.p1  ORF type:complete len:228 (-),score=5.08 GHVS01053862.1:70-753(-)